MENTEIALESLNTAINLDSSLIDGYIVRAAVYFGMENYDSAYSDYNHVLSIKPENEIAIEGMTKIVTNAIKNTTWSAYPVMNGVNMRNYNNGYLMFTLRFGAVNTYRMITELGGYYTGPTAYGFRNGQKIVAETTTNQGTFEVKGTNIKLSGDLTFSLHFKDNIIYLNEVDGNATFEAQFKR